MNVHKILVGFLLLLLPAQQYGALAVKKLIKLSQYHTKKRSTATLFRKIKKPKKSSKKIIKRFYATTNETKQSQGFFSWLFGKSAQHVYQKDLKIPQENRPQDLALWQEHLKLMNMLEKQSMRISETPADAFNLMKNKKGEIGNLHGKILNHMIEARKNGEFVLLSNISNQSFFCYELIKATVNQKGTAAEKKVINHPLAILKFTGESTWTNNLFNLLDWGLKGTHIQSPLLGESLGSFRGVSNLITAKNMLLKNYSAELGTIPKEFDWLADDMISDMIKKYSKLSQGRNHDSYWERYEIVVLTLKQNNPLNPFNPNSPLHKNLEKYKNSKFFFDEKNEKSDWSKCRAATIDDFILKNKTFDKTTEFYISDLHGFQNKKINFDELIERIIREFRENFIYSMEESKEFQKKAQEEKQQQQSYRQRTSQTISMSMTRQEAIKILGLSENFTKEQLRKAFLALVKTTHPDVVPEREKAFASQKMVKIIDAYEFLKNELETPHRSKFD